MICQNKKKIGLIAALMLLMLSFCLGLLLQPSADPADDYYTVEVNCDAAMGTVTISGNPPAVEGNLFEPGATITLVAIPNDGYSFDCWEGDYSSSSSEISFPAQKPEGSEKKFTLTAKFKPKEYAIVLTESVLFEPGTSMPTVHKHGTPTPLPTPAATENYTFSGWIATSTDADGKEFSIKYTGESMALDATAFVDTIYIKPDFQPNPFDVICVDKIGNVSGTELGRVIFSKPYNTEGVSGADAPAADPAYRGYYFINDPLYYSVMQGPVTINPNLNIVERYYLAKTYRIIYQNCEAADDCAFPNGKTELHTYGKDSTIKTPTRIGYTFGGWRIVNWGKADHAYDDSLIHETEAYTGDSLVINGLAYDHNAWDPNGDPDEYAIVLEAIWHKAPYDVEYEGIYDKVPLNDKRQYDEDFNPLKDENVKPTRVGYTFLGWKIKDSDNDWVIDFKILAKTFEGKVTLVAGWQANDYEVTLDPDAPAGELTELGTDRVTATYDSALPQITPPKREGYTFLGYYSGKGGSGDQYYAADGTGVSEVTWNRAENTVLYAHWHLNACDVVFDEVLLEHADITVTYNGQEYPITDKLVIDYGTQIMITVKTHAGYKLVQWQGEAVDPHATVYTVTDYRVQGNITFGGVVAVMEATPAFAVDYDKEIFVESGNSKLPTGNYWLILGEGSDAVYIAVIVDGEGAISVDQAPVNSLSATEYLGKTVRFVRRGDGVTTADSDVLTLSVKGRPAKPVLNTEINRIDRAETSIQIVMNNGFATGYEYACMIYNGSEQNETDLIWSQNPVFTGLKPGTPYYIYVRKAADAENHPHGNAFCSSEPIVTISANYLQEQIDKLMDLKNSADGDYVKQLLQEAAEQMKNAEHTSEYTDQLAEILADAEKQLAFARAQDSAVAALTAELQALKQTNAYSESVGLPALQQIFDNTLAAIDAAKTESEVQRLVNDAKLDLAAVLISYLYFGEELMLTGSGVDSGFRLAAARVVDPGSISSIAAQISRAVQAGTIVVGGTQMTLAQAVKALQTMDVVGYYNFRLTHQNSNMPIPQGPFEVKLLIPAELRGNTGLMVAYYRQGTEELTVLDTRREGNYLIFTASSVESFVILADHDVDLTGAMIALGATLLCQMIAIVLLLIRRRKFAKECRAYGVALPLLALSIRFLPGNAKNITLLLAGLVVLMQLILLWLLLTSDMMFRRKKAARRAPSAAVSPEATAAVSQPTDGTDEPYLLPLAENSAEEEHYEELDAVDPAQDAGDETLAGYESASFEPAAFESNEDAEAAWYGEDFIEPAANPRYSLPEDVWTEDAQEMAEEADTSYTDEYTEEPYDADADAYTEDVYETAYGEQGSYEEGDTEEPEADEALAAEELTEEELYDPMSVFNEETQPFEEPDEEQVSKEPD